MYNNPPYLTVLEDVEQQWETLLHELRTVIVRTNLQEILQKLIDDAIQSGLVGSSQRVHPTVKGPRNTQRPDLHRDVQMVIFSAVIHGLLQSFNLGFAELRRGVGRARPVGRSTCNTQHDDSVSVKTPSRDPHMFEVTTH